MLKEQTMSTAATTTATQGSYQQPRTTSNTNNTERTEETKKGALDDNPIPKDESTTGGNSLSNEAFMRLFLEQLKNQDPTAPMETQEILTQTAQLTQVEAQEKMKTAMEKMTSAMETMQETNKKTIEAQEKMIESQTKMLESLGILSDSIQDSNILSGYNAIGVIGKIAETGLNGITLEKNETTKFSLYFDEPIDASKGSPKISIISEVPMKDKNGDVLKDADGNIKTEKTIVKEISLAQYDGQSGWIDFEWDTKDNGGSYVKVGSTYSISAEYNLDSTTNKYLETELGRGEVQSVLYDQGVPYLKLGEMVVPITYVHTFQPKS